MSTNPTIDRLEPPEPLVMSDTEILDWVDTYVSWVEMPHITNDLIGWEVRVHALDGADIELHAKGNGLRHAVCQAAAIFKQMADRDE